MYFYIDVTCALEEEVHHDKLYDDLFSICNSIVIEAGADADGWDEALWQANGFLFFNPKTHDIIYDASIRDIEGNGKGYVYLCDLSSLVPNDISEQYSSLEEFVKDAVDDDDSSTLFESIANCLTVYYSNMAQELMTEEQGK